MGSYRIIDEPGVKPWGEKIIVSPIVILFAAFIVPIIWEPPALGRFWLPQAWLIVNGLALGSSSLREEIMIVFAGFGAMIVLLLAHSHLASSNLLPFDSDQLLPYTRLLMFAIHFLALYLIVFRQARSYELYEYAQGKN